MTAPGAGQYRAGRLNALWPPAVRLELLGPSGSRRGSKSRWLGWAKLPVMASIEQDQCRMGIAADRFRSSHYLYSGAQQL